MWHISDFDWKELGPVLPSDKSNIWYIDPWASDCKGLNNRLHYVHRWSTGFTDHSFFCHPVFDRTSLRVKKQSWFPQLKEQVCSMSRLHTPNPIWTFSNCWHVLAVLGQTSHWTAHRHVYCHLKVLTDLPSVRLNPHLLRSWSEGKSCAHLCFLPLSQSLRGWFQTPNSFTAIPKAVSI